MSWPRLIRWYHCPDPGLSDGTTVLNQAYPLVPLSWPRLIRWYHSRADQIWPDGPFKLDFLREESFQADVLKLAVHFVCIHSALVGDFVFCPVDQYHEESPGQRTTISLGKFDEAQHLAWLEEHPTKVPQTKSSVSDPWHFGVDPDPDSCLWLMDPDSDPDPAIFVIDLQDASKKIIFLHNFFCLLLFEGTFTSFFKDKKSKRVTK